MGRKNTLKKYQLITSGDMSADVTSSVTNIQYLDNIGIQLNFTGTPIGVFRVQVSADYDQTAEGQVLNAGNWINMALTPTPTASGSADQIYIDILPTSAPWIRVFYDSTSGAGTLNGFITAKMIG
jgi:hypothetical protein